jgi:hypothetical protein
MSCQERLTVRQSRQLPPAVTCWSGRYRQSPACQSISTTGWDPDGRHHRAESLAGQHEMAQRRRWRVCPVRQANPENHSEAQPRVQEYHLRWHRGGWTANPGPGGRLWCHSAGFDPARSQESCPTPHQRPVPWSRRPPARRCAPPPLPCHPAHRHPRAATARSVKPPTPAQSPPPSAAPPARPAQHALGRGRPPHAWGSATRTPRRTGKAQPAPSKRHPPQVSDRTDYSRLSYGPGVRLK